MKIREAIIEDLDQIRALSQELFRYEYANFDKTISCEWSLGDEHKKMYEEAIKDKENQIVLVAEVEGKIVGYVVCSIKDGEFYRNIRKLVEIDDMLVLEKYRNQSIGKQLTKEVIEWAKNKGVKRIRVEASFKNKKTIDFYKKIKFKEHDLILEMEI